jgi:mRNA interferase YafQ
MGRTVHTSKRFEKDVGIAKKRKKDTAKLRSIIDLLIAGQPLPRELNDHPLKGKWNGYRDLHIDPDWVLIYKADDANLWLFRTGSHADVFG